MIDYFVFKVLAHNDSGAAAGHQGGIVIPKDIAEFFPPLTITGSSSQPTTDRRLMADLFIGERWVATVSTRYQHQTWGGKRSPERRLTDNLSPIRRESEASDIMLFAKDLDDDSRIVIRLVKRNTPEYQAIKDQVGDRRWGVLNPLEKPVSVEELEFAQEDIEAVSALPGSAFGHRKSFETVTTRKARDRAFRLKLLDVYDYRCSFTHRKIASPYAPNIVGLDAAHIVPVYKDGSDHPGNGLLLTKELHWAFDRGLVGVGPDRKIFVPHAVGSLAGNEFLRDLHGRPISEATAPSCRALDEALAWHRDNVLLK